MKNRTIALLLTAMISLAVKSSAYPVYMPPGNIVQNGDFHLIYIGWSGNVPAYEANWSSIPHNYAAEAKDIYQNLSTIPGQKYDLSFYAAADLYFGPIADLSVALNGQTFASIETPPYAYDPGVNRTDQMHWQEYMFSFTASSGTTKLEFIDQNTHNFGLAAVSVVRAVPDGGCTAGMLIAGLAILGCCHLKLKMRPKVHRRLAV